jgi:hypothetical protein
LNGEGEGEAMTKAEAEQAIRHCCNLWAKTQSPAQLEHPNFSTFKSWLRDNGYGHYLKFRCRIGAEEQAELWFDQEFKQMWRR